MGKISQSLIKQYLKDGTCEILLKKSYTSGKSYYYREEVSDIMVDGLFFEQELIGLTRDGEQITLPKSRAKGREGSNLKRENDLLWVIEQSKQIIKDLNIDFIDVQPEWKHGDLIAHPDLLAYFQNSKSIFDIKYTATREDDKFNGWGDVDEMDHTQAIHYVYMHYLIFGEWIPFYYLVFGKSGWVRLIKVIVHKYKIEAHRQGIDMVRSFMKKLKPKPINEYNKCRMCPIKNKCEHALTLPQIETVIQD